MKRIMPRGVSEMLLDAGVCSKDCLLLGSLPLKTACAAHGSLIMVNSSIHKIVCLLWEKLTSIGLVTKNIIMAKNLVLTFILFATLLQPNTLFSQEYVVGGDFDYAPFSFIDKTGKPSGLEIEVIEAIAELKGIDLKFQLSSWDVALSKIMTGQTDIIVGIIFIRRKGSAS